MGANTNSVHQVTPLVSQALGSIRRLVRTLRLGDAEAERVTGISSAQLFVLQQLAELGVASINELAARTMTDQSSVSVVVSRLATRRLVTRSPSPTDARKAQVSLTDAGRALLKTAPRTIQDRLIAALHALPYDSLHTMTYDLTQLVALLGAAHEPPTFLFEDDATGAP